MQGHITRRKLPFATWLLVFSPLLWFVAFTTLALHVRIGHGHWPTPMLENYHTPAYQTHEQVVIWVGFFTAFVAIPLWLMMLCFGSCRISLKTHLIQAGVYALGWGLIFLYGAFDPGRFMEWFLD